MFHTDEGPSGATPGETVLFVHGATCDSDDWAAQIPAFAARHRVLAPDLRGHGRSMGASGGFHPRDFAADLAQLIETVDAGPVVVIGHSMGAVVASVLAVEHPELVRAVVAVDHSHGFEAGFAAQIAAAFATPDPIGVATAVLGGLEGTTAGSGYESIAVRHRRRVLGMHPETVREVFLGLFEKGTDLTVRPHAEAYLERRDCPVLTVSAGASLQAKGLDGDWDAAVSPHPYSASLVLDEVGHWLFQERPEEFNALVLGWIDGLPD
nr:alpha/beta hydrolase [Streptomyces sp. S3(2020)]